MDKNAIKKYAVWARRELISRVSQRAALYEITADGYGDQNANSVHGRLMSAEEKKQRNALIAQIKEKGYEQVMEEIAYTWFNRFSALRFMEVNGYLPTRIRVFTNDDNAFKPQILDEAINMEMDGLDMQKVYDLKNANDDDALFKYMIITQCNALSSILPGMFQRISDYTELLFPDNLLREGSVVEQMIAMIPQEDWTDQVQIIGWLYQYYNTEPKDQVFANLKKNIKISKENIPAATQLFTPDWIVRYMVENSLGRLWLEGHPNNELKAGWKYYLDEAEQEPEVQAQLAEIRKEYAALKPEDILAIDPCQGSGHILVYMFDVLVQIYEAYGYSAREAASNIVEHNIWGLDIDERAAQLAYFSVMMKARQYDRRFFSRDIQPHVYAIQESNNLDPHCIEYFVDGRKELKSAMDTLVKELHDAKEYGSILNVTQVDFVSLYARFNEIRNEAVPSVYSYQVMNELFQFIQMSETLAQKYHVVATNPPYMGASGMSPKLNAYIKKNYSDGKWDLFGAFIEKCENMVVKNGLNTMITQHSWMFLSSFEKLRVKMLYREIVNMAHLGARAFDEIGGEVVQTTAFVQINTSIERHIGTYCRLVEPTSQQGKEKMFLAAENRYYARQNNFKKIPGNPIAYWVSEAFQNNYNYPSLGTSAFVTTGIFIGENAKYIRLWFEVSKVKTAFYKEDIDDIDLAKQKWIPYSKGGSRRNWYGNFDYVVNWAAHKTFSRPKLAIKNYFLKEAITWPHVTTNGFSSRILPKGFLWDICGSPTFFDNHDRTLYGLALLASKVANYTLNVINPTISIQASDIAGIPFIYKPEYQSEISALTEKCINISHKDWDSFELSWDYPRHPLLREGMTIEQAFSQWQTECDSRFYGLKEAEERVNDIFIRIYGLEEELSSSIEEKDVTVRRADLTRDIKSLISYAVGCMFGRYSLDQGGLVYAGGQWREDNYHTFKPDEDGIIPICDDEYFEDDIVGRFVNFIETVYGKASLEENLNYIATVLGGRGSSREIIREYFVNAFFKDHCNTYQVTGSGKRPIYWLFDSGKKNGFKCLIYMHRYQPDTIARIRTDYVHEQQSRYRTAIADLESRVANAGTSERVKLTKKLDRIKAQAEELRVYEEKIHHLADQMIRIDLDDGVKVNYAKFQDVLAKIK